MLASKIKFRFVKQTVPEVRTLVHHFLLKYAILSLIAEEKETYLSRRTNRQNCSRSVTWLCAGTVKTLCASDEVRMLAI